MKDVPVDGFWSISVYNADGFFVPNKVNAYTLNNITAKRSDDNSVAIQFGGCDGKIPNCIPTMAGWNYVVRLYRPRTEVLNRSWTFPEAKPTGWGGNPEKDAIYLTGCRVRMTARPSITKSVAE